MARRRRRPAPTPGADLARLALSTLALAVALEVGLRLAGVPAPPERGGAGVQVLAPHPTRLWSLAPGERALQGVTVRVGDDGLRQSPLRKGPRRGAPHRVLTLGDSTVFGAGLADADTLHGALAGRLEARGVKADVLCGGVPGYSSEQALALMDEVGWALRPDLVVVATLWSDNTWASFQDEPWMARQRGVGPRLDRWLQPLSTWRLARRLTGDTSDGLGEVVNALAMDQAPRPGTARRVPLPRYAANLDALVTRAAERGVGAVVLTLANRERLGGREAGWAVYVRAQDQVATHRGLPRVDAATALRAAGLGPNDAFQDDVHPTAAGMAVIAEALADALLAAGWPTEALRADLDAGPPPAPPEDTWATGQPPPVPGAPVGQPLPPRRLPGPAEQPGSGQVPVPTAP